MSVPLITFLSDYGLGDGFVGICHGVIATICPDARVIDITHGIERHDIRRGAIVMRDALPYVPSGIHLAVVDPDVGAERRAVALRSADDRLMVGPDNGLLWLAAEACGGIVEAVDIASSSFRLEPVSATFHGRDVFAPVAAWLARGTPLAELGEPLDPDSLTALELSAARWEGGVLTAHARFVDRFGNVQLDAAHEELAGSGLKLGHAVELELGSERRAAQYVRTFADVRPGELLLYEDASRMLALAVSHGSAAERLELEAGDQLRIHPA